MKASHVDYCPVIKGVWGLGFSLNKRGLGFGVQCLGSGAARPMNPVIKPYMFETLNANF